MKLDVATLIGEVLALWRRDRALLLPLAGLTMFLPWLALELLVPSVPDTARDAATVENARALVAAYAAWLERYSGWYLAAALASALGSLVVVALYLDRRRPVLSDAIARGAVRLPRYVLATMLVGVPAAGLQLVAIAVPVLFVVMFVPLAYLSARTLLIAPVLIAEAPVGAIGAIVRSWAVTRGHGWALAWLLTILLLTSLVGASAFAALERLGGVGGHANPVVVAIASSAASLLNAAVALAMPLLGVIVYRRLASSGT